MLQCPKCEYGPLRDDARMCMRCGFLLQQDQRSLLEQYSGGGPKVAKAAGPSERGPVEVRCADCARVFRMPGQERLAAQQKNRTCMYCQGKLIFPSAAQEEGPASPTSASASSEASPAPGAATASTPPNPAPSYYGSVPKGGSQDFVRPLMFQDYGKESYTEWLAGVLKNPGSRGVNGRGLLMSTFLAGVLGLLMLGPVELVFVRGWVRVLAFVSMISAGLFFFVGGAMYYAVSARTAWWVTIMMAILTAGVLLLRLL